MSELNIVKAMKQQLVKGNIDNISRTVFYLRFYQSHPEIRWALLASAVSRNAGWSMTDLECNWMQRMIPKNYRRVLFMTYERANWLIFEDAYPQLLVYALSKQAGRPLFHLLAHFHVSKFMQEEWERFWKHPEIERLCTALIINEQHVIQQPVIEHPFYQNKVFHSFPFFLEDFFHFSAVLFPTCSSKLYGYTISDFTNVAARIDLGKRLMWLLFSHDKKEQIQRFMKRIDHTGSRKDYERFLREKTKKTSPILRLTYGIVSHHREAPKDWSKDVELSSIQRYFEDHVIDQDTDKTEWYKRMQKELFLCMTLEEMLVPGEK